MSSKGRSTAPNEDLELRIEEISESVRDLAARVTALETGSQPTIAAESRPKIDSGSRAVEGWTQSLVPLVGRALLLLGLAFLLRAITDLEAVPNAIGLALGFAYAMILLVAADRSAGAEEGRTAALFYVIVSAVIAFPLVLEAATRFELLGGVGSALAAGVAAAALLVVADRRRLAIAAAAASLGGGLTLLALLRSFAQPAALLAMLAILGLAVLRVSDRRGWRPWRWSSALMANLGFAVLPAGIHAGRFSLDPAPATWLLLALFTAYLAAFTGRSLIGKRQIGIFEVVQTALAGLVAFGGAWALVGADDLVPGVTALLLGVAAYGIAFSPGVRYDRRRSFFFFTSVGLALVAVGSLEFLPADDAALVWTALGIGCALFSSRYERVTLSLHSTLYLLAALFASGIARVATAGFWMPDPASWPPIRSPHLAIIAAVAISVAIPAARESRSWGRLALAPRAALLLFLVWVVGGALLAGLAPGILGSGETLDAGALATARTALFAVSALLLAWLSRRPRFTEAAWLVYPLLVVAGFRILSQDLREGRPVTLFLSLAVLGASLIASARWLRDRRADSET